MDVSDTPKRCGGSPGKPNIIGYEISDDPTVLDLNVPCDGCPDCSPHPASPRQGEAEGEVAELVERIIALRDSIAPEQLADRQVLADAANALEAHSVGEDDPSSERVTCDHEWKAVATLWDHEAGHWAEWRCARCEVVAGVEYDSPITVWDEPWPERSLFDPYPALAPHPRDTSDGK